MQLLEIQLRFELLIPIITFGLLFWSMYELSKVKAERPFEIDELKSQGFWSYNEVFIASYISKYLEKSKRNEKVLALLYKSINRSNSAIARKVSRFDNAYSRPDDLSYLDNRIHDIMENLTEFEAFVNLIEIYEKLGGNSDLLKKHLI